MRQVQLATNAFLRRFIIIFIANFAILHDYRQLFPRRGVYIFFLFLLSCNAEFVLLYVWLRVYVRVREGFV